MDQIQVEKTVFVVFFAGERAKTKVIKICEAFGANRYPFPEDPNRQWQMKSEVPSLQASKLCLFIYLCKGFFGIFFFSERKSYYLEWKCKLICDVHFVPDVLCRRTEAQI